MSGPMRTTVSKIVLTLLCSAVSHGIRIQSKTQQLSMRNTEHKMETARQIDAASNSRPTGLDALGVFAIVLLLLDPATALDVKRLPARRSTGHAGISSLSFSQGPVAAAPLDSDGENYDGVDRTRRSLISALATGPSFLSAKSALAEPCAQPITIENARIFSVAKDELKSLTHAEDLVSSDILLCGEHHNEAHDHILTRNLLVAMAEQSKLDGKGLTLGLEMFERSFQRVLDAYVAGKLSDDQLYTKSEWNKRWVWPFQEYLPIFQAARALKVPMVALNTNKEVLEKVHSSGIQSIPQQKINDYMPDSESFAQATKCLIYFQPYTTKVITDRFAFHLESGLIDKDATMRNFFAAHVLRDEAMATRMAQAVRARGGRGLLLAGIDHCKFRLGIEQRLRRASPPNTKIRSVLLNPRAKDTLADGVFGTRLGPELESPLLADFVLFLESQNA